MRIPEKPDIIYDPEGGGSQMTFYRKIFRGLLNMQRKNVAANLTPCDNFVLIMKMPRIYMPIPERLVIIYASGGPRAKWLFMGTFFVAHSTCKQTISPSDNFAPPNFLGLKFKPPPPIPPLWSAHLPPQQSMSPSPKSLNLAYDQHLQCSTQIAGLVQSHAGFPSMGNCGRSENRMGTGLDSFFHLVE